jgi:hypothetical protein
VKVERVVEMVGDRRLERAHDDAQPRLEGARQQRAFEVGAVLELAALAVLAGER